MKVTLIDNYDSFVYNVEQYLGFLGAEVEVWRNDVRVSTIVAGNPDAIVISPGPGRPIDAGSSVEVIGSLGSTTPILGICLGHQAIGEAYGATIVKAPVLMHGKTSRISHDNSGVFEGLENGFEATRYHSLTIDPETIPPALTVTAESGEVIMGVRHAEFHWVVGVQFHPESVLTTNGMAVLKNFLKIVRSRRRS